MVAIFKLIYDIVKYFFGFEGKEGGIFVANREGGIYNVNGLLYIWLMFLKKMGITTNIRFELRR